MYYVAMPNGEPLHVYPNRDAAWAAHLRTPGSRMFIEPEIGAAFARAYEDDLWLAERSRTSTES